MERAGSGSHSASAALTRLLLWRTRYRKASAAHRESPHSNPRTTDSAANSGQSRSALRLQHSTHAREPNGSH